MAFYAKIKLEGQGHTFESATLQSYHFDFNRKLDAHSAYAIGVLEPFKINIEVYSEGASKDSILFRWFVNNFTDLKGEITLYSGSNSSSPISKVIKLKEAKIFKMEETFDRHGTDPVLIELGIVAPIVEYGDIMIDATEAIQR